MKTKKTFLSALVAARRKIASGQCYYICWALTHVGGAAYCWRIREMLGTCISYESWLLRHHPKTYKRMRKIPGAFREGRLQWIDDMIAKDKRK